MNVEIPRHTEGSGRPVHAHVFGTGFLVDSAGHILTNHHVLEPWWHNSELIPIPGDAFEATVLSLHAYFQAATWLCPYMLTV